MKKILVLISATFFLLLSGKAQVPGAFTYQAVVRDNTGAILTNRNVSFRVTLTQGITPGTVVYTETHTATTSSQGIVTLKIGKGVSTDNFSSINWSVGNMYLKTEMDPNGGSSYSISGTSELLAVPYALFAKEGNQGPAGPPGPEGPAGTTMWTDGAGVVTTNANVGIGTTSPGGKLIVTADESINPDSALFEVRNKKGEPVFAVYEDGVQVYIPEEGIKGGKGGFAVGGRRSAKGEMNEIFTVYPDSVRVTLSDPLLKGGKGGFAVGGRRSAKGTPLDILTVNQDSVRIYINPLIAKGGKGGFAVGGRSSSKGEEILMQVGTDGTDIYGGPTAFQVYSGAENAFSVEESQVGAASYMRISPINFFIGQESGLLSTGLHNSFVGYQSGKMNTTGAFNVFLGYQSGLENTTGSYNVIMGWKAGYNNKSALYNTYIGTLAGNKNQYGFYNTSVGCYSGANVEYGEANTFLGLNAGSNLENGSNNTFVGTGSGAGGELANPGSGETANNNTFIGYRSGYNISTGSNNIAIGDQAGLKLSSGSNNVFIGHQAGLKETSNSNRFYVSNDSVSKPLLFGEFDSLRLVVGGTKADNLNKASFFVNGTSGGTAAWLSVSDARLKQNVTAIPHALDKVMQLRGVNFNWKDEHNKKSGLQMGFVAQEVIDIVPEVVDQSGEFMSMQYSPITALLVEAIKEQQKQIEQLKEEIELLKKDK